MEHIGNKIAESRNKQGLTQEELADKSKISLRTVQRIENNESVPRGKTLKLIGEILNIKFEKTTNSKEPTKVNKISNRIINVFFLLVLNLVLMSIIGYLTLDSEANLNSRFGAFLLSFFVPIFIVFLTPQMNNQTRLLKFGSGFFLYMILVISKHGFPVGFVTGLIPCLLTALSVLYFGRKILNFSPRTLHNNGSSPISGGVR
tara:strand:+ start:61 stop:669 length:609 start_codon:yes stop_codon:yes gene_type:complete